ncbi:hypothetical protein R1sor_021476 [Riccia sorocarpa]|uniref:Uncharacterized protein n=1 Tax=Riccia sorocarpa TaxID=122646 RepID=A0ABD3GKH7_9MARC
MKVKLLRSRRLKRILLLECGKDFTDKLIAFLVMPVGSVMRRLGSSLAKDGNALYNVYTSLAKLEDTAFRTSWTQTVLIDPSSYYTLGASYQHFVPGGTSFVASGAVFFIGEDLSISRSSTSTALQLLEAVESSFSDIDYREIEAGEDKVLLLVRAGLTSTTPLTDVFGTSFGKVKS